jgi:branched-chain amino acid transport system ATP-binding protein
VLTVTGVSAGYGDVRVLREVSLHVGQGEIVSLLGHNGAGKTTLVNTISGLNACDEGEIILEGRPIQNVYPSAVVARGLVQVPEGRKIFGSMSVLENLEMGAYLTSSRAARVEALEQVHRLFPVLAARRRQLAGTLSGGEQQMLAIGRGLMARPRVLVLDEPSLGLAPKVMHTVLEAVVAVNQAGVTVLLVEQSVEAAVRISARAYVLHNGRVTFEGTRDEVLAERKRFAERFLGVGKKSD